MIQVWRIFILATKNYYFIWLFFIILIISTFPFSNLNAHAMIA